MTELNLDNIKAHLAKSVPSCSESCQRTHYLAGKMVVALTANQVKIDTLVQQVRARDEELRLLRKQLKELKERPLPPPPISEQWIRNQVPGIIDAAQLLERYKDDDSLGAIQVKENCKAYLRIFTNI